jgi:hypothetical protein
LQAEEANLRHALDLARTEGLWVAAVGCLQGLNVLYVRTGRDGEWARLVAATTPGFTDPATDGPLPGWSPRSRRSCPAASTRRSQGIPHAAGLPQRPRDHVVDITARTGRRQVPAA